MNIQTENRILDILCAVGLLTILTLLGGCSDKKIVNFKINSVPKGAHVLYQVVGDDFPCRGEWIYLGNTPVQGVREFKESQIEHADKITLKVMHQGYHDQVKEWDGSGFWKEVEESDVIFWTPELIPSAE